jgi:Winged helix DNA-binding domain
MQTRRVIRTLAAAARWIDRAGLALLFPKADVVLPSLWEQVSGLQVTDWNAEEMNFLWWAKDALPDEGRACVGKHLARASACVAPRLLPALVAANGEPADGDPVVEAIRELGPLTSPQLRGATGMTKKEVDRTIASLHHRLVLTNAHLVDEGSTWGTLAHDLVARKWKLPKRLPPRDDARRELAAIVLAHARELTAADLAGALGWRRKEAAAVLDEIAVGHDDPAGFRIWTRR